MSDKPRMMRHTERDKPAISGKEGNNMLSTASLINQNAIEISDAIACSQGGRRWTYRDLDAASRSLTVLFSAHGVCAGDEIPIFLSRCFESVASTVALLRLGACFVPLDAESWSQERIEQILKTIEPNLVIYSTETNLKAEGIPIISEKEISARCQSLDYGTAPEYIAGVESSPDKPIYIIFTSGTTGIPKGVVIPRRCIDNYVRQGGDGGMPFNLGVCRGDSVLLLFSLGFDAAWGVFFSTLCHGGELILSEPGKVLEDAKRCTVLPATPQLLESLGDPEAYQNIKFIFLGGESPNLAQVKRWSASDRRIYNCYGPTEATICASMAELAPGAPVDLGHPMADTQLLILNEKLDVVDEGEIFISGPGLATGYYKNPQLTAERFITWHGQRLYRTLDLGRKTAESIVFCGREDSMVKNRGYLINLDLDVLPTLFSYPGVLSAAAFMKNSQLVAVITPENIDIAALRRFLSQKYDKFLVPDHIITFKELPRTPNGKADLKLLRSSFAFEQASSMTSSKEENLSALLREAVADALGWPSGSIPMDRSFWELGGNSLLGIKLLSGLHSRRQTVRFQDIFEPTPLHQLLKKLEPTRASESKSTTGGLNGDQSETEATAPMTPTQLGMVRSSIGNSTKSYMLISIYLPWDPEIDSSRVRTAWRTVIERHSIFRTSFDPLSAIQRVGRHCSHDWGEIRVPDNDMTIIDDETDRLWNSIQHEEDSNDFHPVNALRLLVNESGTAATLLWLIHHSLIDGWSIGTIIREVHTSMAGESLPEQPQQFWRLSQLLPRYVEERREEGRPFWRDLLSKVADVSPLNLPKPSQEGSHDGFGQVKADFGLPLSVVQQICAAKKLTPAAVFHAAWALLLRSYGSQNQVVFGSVFSGRDFPLSGIEEVVGPLLNTCPFPIDLSSLATKDEFLAHVQSMIHLISTHQWSAAEAMQTYMPGSHSRILETILFLEYDLPGLHDSEWRFDRIDRPEFGLTVSIRRGDTNLCLRTLFDRSVYTEPVIRRMMSHFTNIFHAFLDPRCTSISELRTRLLDPCEFLSLVNASPARMDPYVGPSNLKMAFETGVDQWPDAVAIEGLTHSITYHELDQLGNYVAERIASLIQPGEAVAILSDRSMDWIIAVIATIKAGAIYVPIDIKLPSQRFRIMIETSKAKLCILTSADNRQKYNGIFDMNLYLPDILAGWDRKHSNRLETVTKPDDVAYITFTSGSTGVPKGVCIEHQSVISYLSYGPSRMDARPGRRHAQMFSPGFDVNQAEIFGTLCYGATLVLYDPEDPFAHLSRVHATMITPSFLSLLDPASFFNLDTILFAGEAVPQALADRWAGRRIVYNSYGPCECTIGCLIQPLQPQVEVTLGRAIPRVGVYILDEGNHPVPIGVPGEICLSGIQVARGYIGSGTEELSQTRFIPDPFVPGHQMYRTGDRAVWTEAMEPRFQGRFDNQVKVRGYRVELTEIENVIGMIDTNVRRVAAVVQGDIIAAFVEPSTVDVPSIQAGLRNRLPAYACPSKIVALPSLPTMPNQKLDRKKLQSYSSPTIISGQKSSTFLQQLLIEAWKTAIGLPEETAINEESDFLALGGSSLSQLRMAQIVCGKLERKLPLKLFIWNTGFLALSDQIANYCTKDGEDLPRTVYSEQPWLTLKPPYNATSYLERELVLLSLSSPTPQAFNVAVQIRLTGVVDMVALKKAVLAVTSSEPILRSCFRVEKETVVRCLSREPCDIIQEEQLDSDVIENLANHPFDLLSGPLTRLLLGRSHGGTNIVLIQHHAVTDKLAIKAFFRRVVIEYLHNIDKEQRERYEDVLPKPGYAAWAQWKSNHVQVSRHESETEYWRFQLDNLPEPPFGQSSGLAQYVGMSSAFSLNWKRTSSGSMELLVTLVALALAEVKKTYDVVIGIPHIDRTEPGTEDLLGVFLDRLPIRIRIPLQDLYDLPGFIQSVGSLIRDGLAHSIPLKDIRKVTTHNDIFQVMVVYNSLEDSISNVLSIPNVRSEEVFLKTTGAKFPLLLEFTEESDSMTCRMEYMEHLLPSSVAIAIGEVIKNKWSQL
ncbi:putative non-ribosomal peptide synthetase SirP/GliP2 [Trichoderma virens Gv29-8]|uniref:Non-ribosomal peptide synthetase SirP/GliP2 n=1 Tax=Hypocrea virens (strain Gv29-8 / FGSC 10586) TaxID=413071 RepID=G9MUZ7_HYPVG|nr:putative non-ribosomal peptide synthetase SirP/GliP2 [Trichoderma virens Gv29-8]EHK21721.1 putative non-ribosomal peptide synthetase SirP/GliP2 [Trichoderma virens Gv29-8]